MDTVWSFRAFASLNTEYWYMHTLATVGFITFRDHTNSPVQTETIIKACKCLQELEERFVLASDALSAIRGAFKMAHMPVPTYLRPFLGHVKHSEDGLLHHATAYILPSEGQPDEAADDTKYRELIEELEGVGLD